MLYQVHRLDFKWPKKVTFLAIIFIAFFLLMPQSALAGCSRILQASIPTEWKPYFHRAPDGGLRGLDIEILNGIFKQANCEYRAKEIPPRRGLEYIKKGKVDFLMAASETAERQKFSYFSVPYRPESLGLFLPKGKAAQYPFRTTSDLLNKKLKIAIGNGAWIGEEIDRMKKLDPEIILFINTKDLKTRLKLLAAGRVDGIIDDLFAISNTAKNMGLDDKIEFSGLVITQSPQHMMFSKKSVLLADVEIINQAITSFKQTLEYQNIIDRYQLQ